MERDNTQTINGLLAFWVEAPPNSKLREEIWKDIQKLEAEITEAKLTKLRTELNESLDNKGHNGEGKHFGR